MSATSRFILVLTAFAGLGHAAGPIATVSSGQPFRLDGHPVRIAGITSWPVVAGDDLATAESSALLYFSDGSRVKLAARSSVKLSGSAAEPKLFLTSGTLDYKLVAGSKVAITNALPQGDTPVSAGMPAKSTLTGTLGKLAAGMPVSSGDESGSGAGIPNALTARLPPVSTFQ